MTTKIMTRDEEDKLFGIGKYCSCKSGYEKNAEYDGHGIFLTYTCPACEDEKMAEFRPDIKSCYDTYDDILDDY